MYGSIEDFFKKYTENPNAENAAIAISSCNDFLYDFHEFLDINDTPSTQDQIMIEEFHEEIKGWHPTYTSIISDFLSNESSIRCTAEAIEFFPTFIRTDRTYGQSKSEDDVKEELYELICSSKEKVLHDSALRALYRLKHNPDYVLLSTRQAFLNDEFISQTVRQAVVNDRNVGLFPLEIALSERMLDLAEPIAARLTDDKPEIRVVCAIFIGYFKIEGHNATLKTLLNDNRSRYANTTHGRFVAHASSLNSYDTEYGSCPYNLFFGMKSPSDAAHYALERLE